MKNRLLFSCMEVWQDYPFNILVNSFNTQMIPYHIITEWFCDIFHHPHFIPNMSTCPWWDLLPQLKSSQTQKSFPFLKEPLVQWTECISVAAPLQPSRNCHAIAKAGCLKIALPAALLICYSSTCSAGGMGQQWMQLYSIMCSNLTLCHTRLGVVVLCNILVAYSVFFVLRIKSVRSSGCLLYSLYFGRGSGLLDPSWQSVDCLLFDTHPSGVLDWCSCLWCLALMQWCVEVVIAWTVESWYGHGSIEHSEVCYWVAFRFWEWRKAKTFWAWYAEVLEFQSSPNQGLGSLD